MRLNLSGYITTGTSYGLVTLNFLRSLTDLGINVATHGVSQEDYKEFTPYVRNSALKAKDFDFRAPSLRIAHQFDMATGIGQGIRFGYTFFEVNNLTDLEYNHLKSLDQPIVPSKWASDICFDSGLSPEVCPPGYNEDVFKPMDYIPQKCIFLSVGKWEVRKQQDQIVRAFGKAFGNNDNVALWMSCDNRFIKEFVAEKKRAYKNFLGDRLHLIDYLPTQNDLARVMQMSYCFVAPSLAEGWNLPLLESMGCGKFNIATNYSAHTEFCDAQSTILIEPTGLVPAVDNMWFKEGSETNNGEWCSYNEDDLVEAMKIAYQQYQDGVILNNEALKNAQKFTWLKSAQTMKDIIYDKN
jgi:glycosyltransferase involved in cell wall biosynthesis